MDFVLEWYRLPNLPALYSDSDLAEATASEVTHRLIDFLLAVHDEGTEADDGFIDWLSGQHQHGGIGVCRDRHRLTGSVEKQHLGVGCRFVGVNQDATRQDGQDRSVA